MLAKTHQQALPTRTAKVTEGVPYFRTDYFGHDSEHPETPQGFLIEQAPHSAVPTHLHAQNQFQVVVRGEGMLGKHPLKALSVHYTNAYTGYGPLATGDTGLFFFTLRDRKDPGAKFFPAARAHRPPGPRRHLTFGPVPLTPPETLRRGKGVGLTVLQEPLEDGMAAWLLSAAPGEAVQPPPGEACGGRYLLVVGGVVAGDGVSYDRWGCIWLSPGEQAPPLRARETGAHLLVLQFPRREATPAA